MENENKLDNDENQASKCSECQRELAMGVDCVRVQQGVIGPRGFVPLGKPTHLCDHECAKRYFGPEEDVKRLPRRVP